MSAQDCYLEPKPECLPDLPQSLITDIFNASSDSSRLYCLYDTWYTIQNFVLFGNNYTYEDMTKSLCLPFWDGLNCWNPVAKDHLASKPCPGLTGFDPHLNVSAVCGSDLNFHIDYNSCLSEEGRHAIMCTNSTADNPIQGCHSENVERLSIIQRDIYFFGSIGSLILLAIALFIFCIFKSLQCPRVNIHKNLLISLMLQCIIHIIIFEPYIGASSQKGQKTTYNEILWLCNVLFTLKNYVCMTNVFWAFVEGLFLYSRISIAVFSTDTPYWLFYAIGWGIPAIFTTAWAICMQVYHPTDLCWKQVGETTYFWIIITPILCAVAANVVFLICIIRILITKLHAVHSAEHIQIRKAMKATVVLLPLLSITSIFFLWGPDKSNTTAYYAYRITNACLQVAQGIFVSVLFCYFNGEVRAALMKYFKRWRTGAFRYRTSRASSVCVTQSEHLMAVGSHRRHSYSSHQSTEPPSSTV